MTLEEFFNWHKKVALAFSGGTDSAFLFYYAHNKGVDIKPYYVSSAFQPQFEKRDARKLAQYLGVALTELEVDIIGCGEVVLNRADRCYHCKQKIFATIAEQAKKDGYEVLIDGTNASDDPSSRPGMAALNELGVLSPLRECALTKKEIVALSGEHGLFTATKYPYACLATRVAEGQKLNADVLRRIELAENYLYDLGFRDFRARIKGNNALLQFRTEQLNEAMEKKENIKDALGNLFDIIEIDGKGRT